MDCEKLDAVELDAVELDFENSEYPDFETDIEEQLIIKRMCERDVKLEDFFLGIGDQVKYTTAVFSMNEYFSGMITSTNPNLDSGERMVQVNDGTIIEDYC